MPLRTDVQPRVSGIKHAHQRGYGSYEQALDGWKLYCLGNHGHPDNFIDGTPYAPPPVARTPPPTVAPPVTRPNPATPALSPGPGVARMSNTTSFPSPVTASSQTTHSELFPASPQTPSRSTQGLANTSPSKARIWAIQSSEFTGIASTCVLFHVSLYICSPVTLFYSANADKIVAKAAQSDEEFQVRVVGSVSEAADWLDTLSLRDD